MLVFCTLCYYILFWYYTHLCSTWIVCTCPHWGLAIDLTSSLLVSAMSCPASGHCLHTIWFLFVHISHATDGYHLTRAASAVRRSSNRATARSVKSCTGRMLLGVLGAHKVALYALTSRSGGQTQSVLIIKRNFWVYRRKDQVWSKYPDHGVFQSLSYLFWIPVNWCTPAQGALQVYIHTRSWQSFSVLFYVGFFSINCLWGRALCKTWQPFSFLPGPFLPHCVRLAFTWLYFFSVHSLTGIPFFRKDVIKVFYRIYCMYCARDI